MMRIINFFIVLLMSCSLVLAGEKLITLKSGETRTISYGLSCVISDSSVASNYSAGDDLVLTLRDIGAKWVGLQGITTNDFNLQDAKGREIKIYLKTPPQNLGYGGTTFAHFVVNHAGDAPQPWTLHFKNSDVMVPFELTITNIIFPRN